MIADIDLDPHVHQLDTMHTIAQEPHITFSPFESLPFELLIHIFSFSIDADPNCVFTLSLVCSKWHAGVHSTPSLWQRLRLNDHAFDPARLQARSNLWIDRSGRLPLDVEIKSVHQDSMLPMLSYTLSVMGRWRTFTSSERIQFHWKGSRRKIGGVDDDEGLVLVVDLQHKRRFSGDLGQDSALSSLSEEPCSVETFVKDKGPPKEIHVKGVWSLPKSDSLTPFSSITSLIVSNAGWKDMPLHQCVEFFGAFPMLAYLKLMNRFVQDPDYNPDCPIVKPVILPHLRRLTLSIASTRCLLSHMTMPALERLELMYINSSVEYDHPITYALGDSDDEAHDFSRSPWTDRATGMGLRSLFGRCSPPLHELVMDFADLRTKDFKWAFGAMKDLETLRVVASDMSDKVIAALAVKSGSESIAQVPLPRLKRLYLDKCQKISGDVFMGMMESRMQAAEQRVVSRMETLETLECTGISLEHAGRMRRLLGVKNVRYRPAMGED